MPATTLDDVRSVPTDCHQGPATRRLAPEPVRPTSRRSSRPVLIGHRPLAKALTVNQAGVLVDYKVRIEPPKSLNGKWTLPDELVAALTELRKRQLSRDTNSASPARPGQP
jgi:hypothetical protein